MVRWARKKTFRLEGLDRAERVVSGLAQCRRRLPLRTRRQAQVRIAGVIIGRLKVGIRLAQVKRWYSDA